MSRPAWLLVAACTLVGLAVAAVLFLRGEPTESPDEALRFRGRSMAVEARITPRLHAFGEPIVAEAVAVFNRALVRPDSVRMAPRFDPYEIVRAEPRTRVDEGTLTRVTFRFHLRCLTRQCLPGEPKRTIEFEPAGVGYTMVNPTTIGPPGARTGTGVNWPPVEVASRLDPTATQDVRWRAETRTLPEPSFRVDPMLATFGLLGGAGALVGVAAGLLLPFAPRRRGAVVVDEIDESVPPLERALLLLESSRNGVVSDRRRTLELVARELDAHGETGLAQQARRLAWSQQPPSSEAATALADSVRATTARESEDDE